MSKHSHIAVQFTYPSFTVLASLMTLLGDSVAIAHLPAFCAFAPAIFLGTTRALLRLPKLRLGRFCSPISYPPSMAPLRLLVCLLLVTLPILFYCFASLRMHTDDVPIQTSSDGTLIVRGYVTQCTKDNDTVDLQLSLHDLVFPSHKRISGSIIVRCTARTILIDSSTGRSAAIGSALCDHETVSVEVRLKNNRGKHSMQSFGAGRLYYTQRLWLERDMLCHKQVLEEMETSFDDTVIGLRKKLVRVHQQILGEQNGSLLASMVLGDKAVQLDPSLVTIFRNVGLSHVLAASGFNITVVIAMTYFVGRSVLRASLPVTVLCLLTMVGYVCLAGASASVMRAAVMCTLMLVVRSAHLRINLLATLALSLIITILIDPASVTDVGLQLSYAATAGILVLAKPLVRLWSTNAGVVRRWLAEAIAVVFASQTAVLPIQLIYFCQIGLMFVPANLAVTPMLGPVTILGFSSSVLSLACPPHPGAEALNGLLCRGIDMLAALPLIVMVWIVKALASYDSAILRIGPPSCLAVVLYVLGWFGFVLAMNVGRYRLLGAVIFGATLFGMIWRPPLPVMTIFCLSDAIVIADRDRHATVILGRGDAERSNSSQRMQKLLALRGWNPARTVQLASPSEPFKSIEIGTSAARVVVVHATSEYLAGSEPVPKPTVLVAVADPSTALTRGARKEFLGDEAKTLHDSAVRSNAEYLVLVGNARNVYRLSTQFSSLMSCTVCPKGAPQFTVCSQSTDAVTLHLQPSKR